jgi:uncharacterized protein (TIRG00374 family)
MKNNLKNTLILAKLTISISLIWFILNKFNFKDSLVHISNISPGWAALATTLLASTVIFASLRFREILHIMNQKTPSIDAFIATYIGYFFSQTALSFVGGDAMRIMHLSKQKNISAITTAKAVILDRVSGFFGQIVLLSLTLPFLLPRLSNSTIRVFIMMTALSGLLALVLIPTLAKLPKQKKELSSVNLIIDFARRFHKRMSSWHAFFSFLVPSILIALTNCLVYFVICLGMSINIHLIDIIILMPPVFFLSMLPISFSGWGIRESSTVFALSLVGVPSGDALAVSVCFGLLLLVISLPGALFWLRAAKR